MASAMTVMKKMELGFGYHGPLGVILDGAAGFGISYGLGRLHHQHQDKWYGKHASRIAAIGGKAGAVLLSMFGFSGAASIPVGLFNAAGQAGLNAIGLEMGLRHAREKTGKKAILVDKSVDVKKLPGATEMTSIGALGKAKPGRSLGWNQIEALAQGR